MSLWSSCRNYKHGAIHRIGPTLAEAGPSINWSFLNRWDHDSRHLRPIFDCAKKNRTDSVTFSQGDQEPIFCIFFPQKIPRKIQRKNFSPQKCQGKLEFSTEKVTKNCFPKKLRGKFRGKKCTKNWPQMRVCRPKTLFAKLFTFTVEKVAKIFWATSLIFIKLAKVNIHPIGENSPNVVTLLLQGAKMFW
jgi:hypothetical protein